MASPPPSTTSATSTAPNCTMVEPARSDGTEWLRPPRYDGRRGTMPAASTSLSIWSLLPLHLSSPILAALNRTVNVFFRHRQYATGEGFKLLECRRWVSDFEVGGGSGLGAGHAPT